MLFGVTLLTLSVGLLAMWSRQDDRPLSTKAPPEASERFGVNAQGLFLLPPREQEQQARLIARAGLRTVRLDLIWHVLQPSAGTAMRFERFDGLVLTLARAGIRVRPILDYSAGWASEVRGEQRALPRRASDFARYAATVAEHYGAEGTFWKKHTDVSPQPMTSFEIWNEPNLLGYSRGGINPRRYADLVVVAADAVRDVHPDAEIVLGGLADIEAEAGLRMGATRFLRSAVKAKPALVESVDAVGLHSYARSATGVAEAISRMVRALDATGMGSVAVELNEWGIDAQAPGAPTAGQRTRFFAEVPRTVQKVNGCRVRALLPHTWVRPADPPGGVPSGFSLVGRDAVLTPAALAYASAARSMTGACGD